MCDTKLHTCVVFHCCSCFIGNLALFLGGYLSPVLTVVIMNTVLTTWVLMVAIKHNRRSKRIKTRSIRTLILMVSICFDHGVHWLLCIFTVNEASVTFQYLFVIFILVQVLSLSLKHSLRLLERRHLLQLRKCTCPMKQDKRTGEYPVMYEL